MVSGKFKSRSLRRVKVRTPSAQVKIHYRRRTPGKPICGMCHLELHGIPRNVSKLSKTQKRPERIFGGVLCSRCSREVIKESVRAC